MTTVIIETIARASIREFWKVEDYDPNENLDLAMAEFLWDEVLGDEEDRRVDIVHSADDLRTTVQINHVQQYADRLLKALRECEQVWSHYYRGNIEECGDDTEELAVFNNARDLVALIDKELSDG